MIGRSWVFDFDRYVIQKGYGAFDMDALAQAILANPDEGLSLLFSDPSIRINVLESELTGVEIDAIDMALKTTLDPEFQRVAQAIHDGPTNPEYNNAIALAIRQGAPLINSGIEQQNRMNANAGRGFESMDPAFTIDQNGVTVNSPWRRGAMAQMGAQITDKKTRAVNPFDKSGTLVTHILSPKMSKNTPEGWARPYEEALQSMGVDKGGRRDRYIRAHKDPSKRRTVSFHDDTQFLQFKDSILTSSQVNPQPSTEEAASAAVGDYLATNNAFTTTGLHHHALESTLARNMRADDPEMPILDEQLEQERVEDQLKEPTAPPVPDFNQMRSIIHPEDRDQKWLNNMQSNTNAYLMNNATGKINQNVVDYLTSPKHNMSEEEARKLITDVRFGRGSGGVTRRFMDALTQHHSSSGIMPGHYEGDAESTADPISTTDSRQPVVEQPPVQTPDPTAPIPPAFPPPAAPIPIPDPNPPPPQGVMPPPTRTRAAPPVPDRSRLLPIEQSPALRRYLMSTMPGIKRDIPSSDTPARGSGGDSIEEQIAQIMSQLENGNPNVSKSAASDIEGYLEMVQMELAKAVIEDKFDVPDFNIDSPTDIAMMGAHIQRPTTDVIGILFTKGDWRNIAKTMGIEHEKVQLVKVAFS
tara:strand:+ start:6318 stop:8240 length:1923 start_codon:yes stop_codon:yes gene_type:complete